MHTISYKLLHIIWILTEVFFILSILFLCLFFILKKIFDRKKNSLLKKTLSMEEIVKKEYLSLETDQEIITYAKSIGNILMDTTDFEKRMALKKHIQKINLYPKIYILYTHAYSHMMRLYFLSLIIPLAQAESNTLYHHILTDKKTKDISQFYTLAIFGLALSSTNTQDITSLYSIVEKLALEKNITQKLSQFFFTEAFKSVGEAVCILFFSSYSLKKITSTTNAMIYALQNIPSSETIENKLLLWHQEFPDNTMLLITILRVLYIHKSKHYSLILHHHTNHNNLIRIVCAKIGIDLLPREKLGILTHYLCDKNIHVRKNFLLSLAQHNISFKEIYRQTMKYYPNCFTKQQSCSSLEAYKKGLL